MLLWTRFRANGAIVAATAAVLTASAPAHAEVPPEVWVAGEGSRTIRVITTATPETLLPVVIDLGGGFPPPAPAVPPAPHGIAFSTMPPGRTPVVFVAQGRYLRVIGQTSRVVLRTLDGAGTLPPGRTFSEFYRIRAARPVELPKAGGGTEWKSFLHAAATLVDTATGRSEPWFYVFDQEALACTAPPCPTPFVDRGALPVPAGVSIAARDVLVMHAPYGNLRQRVYLSGRETDGTRVASFEIARGGSTSGGWATLTGSTQVADHTGAPASPEFVPLMAPYDRETPLWGTACDAGTAAASNSCVSNLDRDGCLTIPERLTGGTLVGEGTGDHSGFVTVDAATPLAAAGTLYRFSTRFGIQESYPVGSGPADVIALDPINIGKVFVANRNSDDVTVLRPGGVTATIPLVPGTPFYAGTPAACSFCAGAIATQGTACSVSNVTESIVDGDGDGAVDDVRISWVPSAGCPDTQYFLVECKCSAGAPLACPSECPWTQLAPLASPDGPCISLEPIGDPDTAGEWTELGPRTSGSSTTHLNAASFAGFLSYTVVPDGI